MPNCKWRVKFLPWSRETLWKARSAALRLIGLAFAVLLALLAAEPLGRIIGRFVVPHLLERAWWPRHGFS